MAFTSHLNNLAKQSARASSGGDSNILKTSAIIGLASGLVSAGLYFLYKQYASASSGPTAQDRMAQLKQELINELNAKPIEAEKDPKDHFLTRDFMIYMFRLLYTYQTIGKEVVKEQHLECRISHLRDSDFEAYQASLDSRSKDFIQV